VIPAGDIRTMGSLPAIFTGNRAEAENFINGVQAYLRLNREVPGFNSPMKKIALTLTLMQGEKVAGWANDIGEVLDDLNPATDNIPALWTVFLEEFRKQYLDTQSADRARAELENLSMKIPYIDEYISKFEELCRKSGYLTGNAKVTYMFLRGLPKALLEDILKAPQAEDYPAMKERAIQATRTQQLLQNILRQRPQSNQTGQPYRPPFFPRGGGGFQEGAFGNFQRSYNQRGGFRPFQNTYRPNNFGNNQGNNYQGNHPSQVTNYNSTNAPRSMNNIPVPMDVDRARFNRNRGFNPRYQGTRGRVANAGPNGQTRRTPNPSASAPCFKCGGTEHWANRCPMQANQSSLIDFNDNLSEDTQMTPEEIKERIEAMTPDEKAALANSMEIQEQDFPTV